jgi:GNAT superfamily N-acetyltransferase
MSEVARPRVRPARRHDVPALVELRVQYLFGTARIDPRFRLVADVRERTLHALPLWIEQEDRVLLVAEDEAAPGRLLGYATGLLTVWPPVFRNQHVGEVLEAFVLPDVRGRGHGRDLLNTLADTLVARGASVLRAPVPSRDEAMLQRFTAVGYTPLQRVLERNLEEA